MTAAEIDQRGAIALAHGARGTTLGLEIPEGLSYEEWRRVGEGVLRMDSAGAWWVGDWLFYGEFKYGEKYRAALLLTGLDEKTLRNQAYVAGKIEMSRRRDTLSFSHHAEIAGLRPAEQDAWLDLAESEGLSRNSLRELIRGAEGTTERPEALPTLALRGLEERIERWREAAEAAGLDVKEWAALTLDSAAEQALAASSR